MGADVSNGATLTFNNALNLNGNSLTKTGGGMMAINNFLNTGGGAVILTQGTMSGDGTVDGTLNNDGGTVGITDSTISENTASMNGGGVLLDVDASGAESIVEILQRTQAEIYLTGAGAGSMRHLDVDALRDRGIEVQFSSTEFPAYSQLHGSFEPQLSIVDALFNCGPEGTRALIFENAV